MKKKYSYIPCLLLSAMTLVQTSCNDFLDREPLSSVTASAYLSSENELATFGAGKYEILPSHKNQSWDLGIFSLDNNSDNQAGTTFNKNFVKGELRVESGSDDDVWDFQGIRDCNYFLATVLPKYEAKKIIGNEANIRHYIGEMYFFRAYLYFLKLQRVGDCPIVTTILTDNYNDLLEANKRQPRNKVGRFILEDLDKAIEMLKDVAPQANRLNKMSARLLKSRVALFEGTWEKYHAGTARVPKGPNWPGEKSDYLKDFTYDANTEISYFLGEAMKEAQIVADAHPLGDYASMFNSYDLSSKKEVLLWRKYDNAQQVQHHVNTYLQDGGGGASGFTRSLVESFLMKNGLPIYATGSTYQGDVTVTKVRQNRDERLVQSMIIPDETLIASPKRIFTQAPILDTDKSKSSTTGYCIRKGLDITTYSINLPSTTACPVFRSAEAYLNYLEADYVLNNRLDAKSIAYWKALRKRAGVDEDFTNTINRTDLSKENDLAVYSGNAPVDATLYNIRRERRCELIAEGFRKMDIYRWRSLDRMKEYHIEGFNLWDEEYKSYVNASGQSLLVVEGDPGVAPDKTNVSRRSVKYLRPMEVRANNVAYKGYNFTTANYLEPIPFNHFRLSTPEKGGDPSTSIIYQNPGWSIEVGSAGNDY